MTKEELIKLLNNLMDDQNWMLETMAESIGKPQSAIITGLREASRTLQITIFWVKDLIEEYDTYVTKIENN